MIFVLGIVRDYLYPYSGILWLTASFERALASQPAMDDLQGPIFKYIGATLFFLGNLFVISSMYALGITGTYLGIPLSFSTFSDDRRLFRHLNAGKSDIVPIQYPQ